MSKKSNIDRAEWVLRNLSDALVRVGLLIAFTLPLVTLLTGPTGLFVFANAVVAVIIVIRFVFAGFCVIRHRSILAMPNMSPVALISLTPIIATWGSWQHYSPNLVVAVLAAFIAIMHRMVVPKEQRNMPVQTRAMHREQAAEPAVHETYAFPAVRPKYTFAAVNGMADVKARLLEAGQEITQEQKQLGQIHPRNGILLFGEPGNGKTFFAEALAGELSLPMISVTFGDVASQWVNKTTEQVMQAFKDARAQSPCLIFLDEIDSLIRDRSSSMAGGTDEAAKTTNAILTELVKIRESQVVVVAATNYLDKLDQAAIREGRFDFKVEITPPDELARAALIRASIVKHAGLVVSLEGEKMAARRWSGFSVARIRTVADEACRAALKAGRTRIEYVHLQEALRTIQGRKGTLPEGTPNVDDLIMMPSQKQRLVGIATRMRDIERIEEMGGTVPTGVLFYGPPGTGKTLTARALAKTSGWAFISVSGNDLLAQPDRIDTVAREARDIRPCIVFIDEADDVLADRRFGGHGATVTNRLLTAIDGAGGKVADVVWVAATNHPENMDAAALRGGRFTEKIEFALPDQAVITEYVRSWMQKSKARFDAGLTPGTAAEVLQGLSIANIGATLQQAVDLMVERRVTGGHPDECTTLEDLICARSSVAGG